MSTHSVFSPYSRARSHRGLAYALAASPLLMMALSGCGSSPGGNVTPTPPAPPITGSVSFAAPTAVAAVKKLPVAVNLSLSGGALASNVKLTLNGVDVTSVLSASGTTMTGSLSQGVYVGANRLAAVNGANITSMDFNYDPATTVGASTGLAGGAPTAATNSTILADVIPIQTRVRMTNTSGQAVWGIQIGQTAYPAPNGTTQGFQVLVLNRRNLSLVSNTNFEVLNDGEVYNFASNVDAGTAGYSAKCGLQGCMVIMQSLDAIGYAPCNNNILGSCVAYQHAFYTLGATSLLGNIPLSNPSGIGYSLIALVTSAGLVSPSSYERITCSTGEGCVNGSTPGTDAVTSGVTPNGLDGVTASLAGTGATGTTNLNATNYLPGMTVSNNGAMAGVLFLDNYSNYAFTWSDPPIHVQMGLAPNTSLAKHILILDYPSSSLARFPNGTTHQAVESSQLPAGAKGGFHLAVFDAVTFQNVANNTYVIDPTQCGASGCQSPDGSGLYPLQQLTKDIVRFNTRRYLFFLGSIGSLNHTGMQDPFDGNDHQPYMQDVWDRAAQSVQDIGGTYSLFASLDYPGYVNNPWDQYNPSTVPDDDYNMIGQWWLNNTNMPNPLATEASLAIHRQTMKYPVPGNLDATLTKGIDGYYRTGVHTSFAGFLSDATFALTSAPLQLPQPWPLTGTNDSNALKAAYSWISQQTLKCINGCGDVRLAYTDLNQNPAIWLTQINALTIPADCASSSSTQCRLGFGQAEFDAARSQLLQEFQYLGLVRQYQNNVLGLLQSEQANVSLLLQQASDEVLGSISYVTRSTVHGGGLETDLKDSFGIAGSAASGIAGVAGAFFPEGAAIAAGVSGAITTSFSIADLIMDQSSTTVYDPNGRSLQEQAQDQIATSALAQNKANQYAATLTAVGAGFRRIVSDWGRLQTVGAPLQNHNFVWTPETSGALLSAYNASIRRSAYTTLLPVGYQVVHMNYSLPGTPGTYSGVSFQPGAPDCAIFNYLNTLQPSNPDSYMFIPGALIDGPGSNVAASVSFGNVYPFDLWWDTWFLQNRTAGSSGCPPNDGNTFPSASFYTTTGLFRPLDPANSTALGLYKPWFYTRSGFTVQRPVGNGTNFWRQYGIDGGQPYIRYLGNWWPDPDSY